MLNCVVVSSLFYLHSSRGQSESEVAARNAYRSMDKEIHTFATRIMMLKQADAEERAKVAHPPVSQAYLEQCISNLLDDPSSFSPLKVRLLEHI
jgi:hypothetical protein